MKNQNIEENNLESKKFGLSQKLEKISKSKISKKLFEKKKSQK